MSIQFMCPGCNQPIEIDNEFGGALVGCPYCRKTVTAPRESTLQAGSGPLAAKPVVPPASGTLPAGAYVPAPSAPYARPPEQPSRNVLAIVAFSFSLLTLFFCLVSAVNLGSHSAELQQIIQDMERFQQRHGSGATPEAQREMQEMIESWADWVWISFGGMCVAMPCGLTALVCGIIGVCRPRRRGWAVASLVILLVGPAILCFMPAGASMARGGSAAPLVQPSGETDSSVDGKTK